MDRRQHRSQAERLLEQALDATSRGDTEAADRLDRLALIYAVLARPDRDIANAVIHVAWLAFLSWLVTLMTIGAGWWA